MTLALAVGNDTWPVGHPDTLHAFFSSISHHLEPDGWGTRFPALMRHLYQGEVPGPAVEAALSELAVARRELAAVPPHAVVWDIDDLSVQPPWGTQFDPAVANLARYFHSVDGRDLFDVVALALVRLRAQPGGTLRIVDTPSRRSA